MICDIINCHRLIQHVAICTIVLKPLLHVSSVDVLLFKEYIEARLRYDHRQPLLDCFNQNEL